MLPGSSRARQGEMKAGGMSIGEPGSDTSNYIGSDPLAIYRSGASKQIPADRAMAANTDSVFAYIKAIAREMAGIQIKLFQINEGKEHEELYEHEILDLLDCPWDMITGPELKYVTAGHLEAVGNAYWLLLKGGEPVKSFTDKPDGIFPLSPQNIKILINRSVFPYHIKGYEYREHTLKIVFEPYQILQIKSPDFADPFEGIGTVQAAAVAIDLDKYSMEMNRQFFLRGSKVGDTFETDASDEASLLQLKETYDATHSGAGNSNRPLFLPKGVKRTAAGMTAKDMDFGKLMESMQQRLQQIFGVSPTILGTAEADTNRATSETADYVFAKRNIKPKMIMICSYLNEFLVSRWGDNLYLGFLDPTPEDKNMQMENQKTDVGSQALLSINEGRMKYRGLGPIKGGDAVLVANNLVPVGTQPATGDEPSAPDEDQGTPTEQPQQEEKPSNVVAQSYKPEDKIIRPASTRFIRNMKIRQAAAETFADLFAKKLKELESKPYQDMTDQEYGLVWQKFDERVTQTEAKVRLMVQAMNDKQKQEVLENLPKLIGKGKSVRRKFKASDLFDKQKWVTFMIDSLTPTMTELYKTEGLTASTGLGKPGVDLTQVPTAMAAFTDAMSKLADHYQQTTLDDLSQKIREGIEAGQHTDEIADTVEGVYDYMNETRSQMVARTETFRTANTANKMAWQESGVETLIWFSQQDGDVCPDCQSMNGKEQDINVNFFDQGDTFGEQTFDYGDVEAPPLHVQCRCFIRPGKIPGVSNN